WSGKPVGGLGYCPFSLRFPASLPGTTRRFHIPCSMFFSLDQNYLRKYYHLRTGTNRSGRQRSSSLVTEKLKQMQAFFGLKVTGKVDADTLTLMRQPRCGVPDVAPYALGERTLRWEHTHLTYRLENYTPDLPRADVDSAIDRAFQLWSNASALTFTRVFEGQADIMISFVRGDHNDNNPFGGPGNIIAHAFPPGGGIGGDVHFDEDKRWTKDFRNFNLYHVAAHEVGHSLGLMHDGDIESLMFSSYNYYGDNLLTQRDIDAIQALYGETCVYVLGPSKNPIQPRERQVPQACESKLTFDAITEIRGELYFFKNRPGPGAPPWGIKLSLLCSFPAWEPCRLSSRVPGKFSWSIFWLTDSKVWAFNAVKMRQGYPKDIYHSLGFPHTVKSIDAAVHEEETGKTYFFVATNCVCENGYCFHEFMCKTTVSLSNTIFIFISFPGFFYFFRGKRQYKFDPHTKRILTILNINSWFNCRNK
uniref:Peptidase metallopeptidase domain-containing protein n=1 Tax=Neovison vison TaxID=452646 RepID=A0A8C7BRE9_NEOVI